MPAKGTIPRVCEQCNEPFMAVAYKVKRGGGRFCSPACYALFRSENKPLAEETFWQYVQKTDSCWLWTGARDEDEYGVFWDKVRQVRAHRFSYELHHGPLADGMMACHTCDNPPCVNPAHLFPGDAKKNHEDMMDKGRGGRGESVGTAKLTETVVIAIRHAYTGKRGDIVRLARQYGVSEGAIAHVAHGRSWTHIKAR